MKGFVNALIAVIFAANFIGCSSKSANVEASYVSPIQYNTYNCKQIGQELQRINRKVLEISGKQDSAATKDAVALGVGLILFWPALFFMIGGDKKHELSKLKGEYEAIQQAAIEKECDISKEMEAIEKAEEENEKKKTKVDESSIKDTIH